MLNEDRIHELREEVGEDGFGEVVSLFCEEVEEVLNELPELDPVDLLERIHFLKGSALNVGMEEVAKLCILEERRLREDSSAVPDVASIRHAFQTARNALAPLA